jgi:hypothetical protein
MTMLEYYVKKTGHIIPFSVPFTKLQFKSSFVCDIISRSCAQSETKLMGRLFLWIEKNECFLI